MKKLMLDTAPFIYLIRKHTKYCPAVKKVFQQIVNFQIEAVTSTITLIEVLTQPIKKNDKELERQYADILVNNECLEIIPVNISIAREAARLRAQYELRTPDAIQLASGVISGCDSFLTNDKRLRKVNELEIILVEDLPQ